MKIWKTLVVGVDLNIDGSDLSAGSQRAIRQAEWIAARSGGKVILVHSTTGDRFVEEQKGHWSILHEGITERGRARLEEEGSRLRSMELDAEVTLREERPFIAIIKEAIERKADLVLLGKHEEETDGARIGSVAIKVLRKCPCPVWIVKPGTELAPKTIVAATDLSEVGARAIEYALLLADGFQSEAHVVHAFQMPFGERMIGSKEGRSVDEEIRLRAVAAVKEQIAKSNASVEPKLHIGNDAPNRALLGADEHLKPDLFVMGSVSRSGIPGFLVGNTAENVLPKLRGSLLVVKPAGFESPIS